MACTSALRGILRTRALAFCRCKSRSLAWIRQKVQSAECTTLAELRHQPRGWLVGFVDKVPLLTALFVRCCVFAKRKSAKPHRLPRCLFPDDGAPSLSWDPHMYFVACYSHVGWCLPLSVRGLRRCSRMVAAWPGWGPDNTTTCQGQHCSSSCGNVFLVLSPTTSCSPDLDCRGRHDAAEESKRLALATNRARTDALYGVGESTVQFLIAQLQAPTRVISNAE
jgi:hypothetical protein